MLRTCILSPRINPVATDILLLVGYWLLRSILVISLWTDSLGTGGGFHGSGTTAEGVSPTDGKLAGIPEKMSCWLIFDRV